MEYLTTRDRLKAEMKAISQKCENFEESLDYIIRRCKLKELTLLEKEQDEGLTYRERRRADHLRSVIELYEVKIAWRDSNRAFLEGAKKIFNTDEEGFSLILYNKRKELRNKYYKIRWCFATVAFFSPLIINSVLVSSGLTFGGSALTGIVVNVGWGVAGIWFFGFSIVDWVRYGKFCQNLREQMKALDK